MSAGRADTSAAPQKQSQSQATAVSATHRALQTSQQQHAREEDDAPLNASLSNVSLDVADSTKVQTESKTEFHEPSYTKTGRLSKSLKGKRVHACEYCPREYTRAEHLRRHQLMHSPNYLQCDEPKCGRLFQRRDLLIKHKDAHAKRTIRGDRVNGTRSSSIGSEVSDTIPTSMNEKSVRETGVATVKVDPSIGAAHFGLIASHSDRGGFDVSLTTSPSGDASISTGSSLSKTWQPTFVSSSQSFASAPDYSYDAYSSTYPTLASQPVTYDQEPWERTSYWSEEHGSDPSVSTSTLTTWESSPQSSSPVHTISDLTIMPTSPSINGHDALVLQEEQRPSTIQYDSLDAEDYAEILRDLSALPHIFRNSRRIPMFDHYRQKYLGFFWQYFHPIFPIIHRPSFHSPSPPSLLTASMMAIGAHYSVELLDKQVAVRMHDTCLRLLDQRLRQSFSPPDMNEMQCIFLVEAFGQFRARRGYQQLSQPFLTMYNALTIELDAHPKSYLEALTDLPSHMSASEAGVRHLRWLTVTRRAHLFAACFVLEDQQLLLPESERRPGPSDITNIPVPSPPRLWEADGAKEWVAQIRNGENNPVYMWKVMQGTINDTCLTDSPLCAAIATAFLTHSPNLSETTHELDSDHLARELHLRNLFSELNSPRSSSVHFHGRMVAALAPIRALLAVAGESWVLGESSDAFKQAEMTLELWVASDEAKRATWHAVRILLLVVHSRGAPTGLVSEDWILYLCALILWAQSLRLRQSEVADLRNSYQNLEVPLLRFLRTMCAAPSWSEMVHVDSTGAQLCLTWTMGRMASAGVGKLTQDAALVLKKLVAQHPAASTRPQGDDT